MEGDRAVLQDEEDVARGTLDGGDGGAQRVEEEERSVVHQHVRMLELRNVRGPRVHQDQGVWVLQLEELEVQLHVGAVLGLDPPPAVLACGGWPLARVHLAGEPLLDYQATAVPVL